MDDKTIKGTNCTTCIGVENCDKHCPIHTGVSLINFLTRADTEKSDIGDKEPSYIEGVPDYTIIGMRRHHNVPDMSRILVKEDYQFKSDPKFDEAFGCTPHEIIEMTAKEVNISDDVTEQLLTKLDMLNSNKILINPFKTGDKCQVYMKHGNGSSVNKREGIVQQNTWSINRETGELEMTMHIYSEKARMNKTIKVNVQDYMDTFTLSKIEMRAKGKGYNKGLIKANKNAIFRPSVLVNKNTKQAFVLDNTYMYQIKDGVTTIVGYWDNQGKLVETAKLGNGRLIKAFRDNVYEIATTRRYMAPYGMMEPAIVKYDY